MATNKSVTQKNKQPPSGEAPIVVVPKDLVELGRIIGGHGIRGWVKIQPYSAESDAMSVAKQWWLAPAASPINSPDQFGSFPKPQPFVVSWAKPHGNLFLAALKEVTDRNASEALKGHSIFVSRQLFPRLELDEYYWVDLMACLVMTDASGDLVRLGVVQDILDNPAHAILVVKRQCFDQDSGTWEDQLDAKGRPLTSMIPFVGAHIASVDLAARSIFTHWPADF